MELIWRWKSNELPVDIPLVISNHPDLREVVESYGIPYYHIPVTQETKQRVEQKMLELLEGNVDFIALARYMQILSPNFVSSIESKSLTFIICSYRRLLVRILMQGLTIVGLN